MTKFEGCCLTNAGLELSRKSGINLVFTRAETGSGIYESKDEVRELTSLKKKEYEYQLEDVQLEGEYADVIFYVTNKGVTEEYKLTEIGIYAENEIGEEILYCVVFAFEENAETIDPEVAGQITYCKKFCVQAKVSDTADVSVQIVGTDHEFAVNYFKKYAGEVELENGTLQEQIKNHTHGRETIVFSNISVDTTTFESDETYTDYPYKAELKCNGVTSDYVPMVNLGMTDAISGNYAPICESGENTVTIYAVEVPSEIMIIPSIICVKGGDKL